MIKKTFKVKNIKLELIPEQEDKWKSYSSDCKTQRTRINNIFNALFKNTTNKIGITFDSDVNIFTRSLNDNKAWEKIYNQINLNVNTKPKNSLVDLKNKESKTRNYFNKLYRRLKDEIYVIRKKKISSDQEKSISKIKLNIDDTYYKTEKQINEREREQIKFPRSEKEYINIILDIYNDSMNYLNKYKDDIKNINKELSKG